MKHLTFVALTVLALSVAAQPIPVHAAGQAAAKAMKTTGTVKSVSGTQLVIAGAGGKDMTFTVDSSTKFTGKGLSTKSKGAPIAASDAVHQGDRVSVSYHDMSGTMHAASVVITQAAMTKK